MTTLFVAKLSDNTTGQALGNLFSSGYGAVTSAKVVMDRESGKSRGFGFVAFKREADAQKAIKGLNGSRFNDQVIAVAATQANDLPLPTPINHSNRGDGFGSGFQSH